MKRITNPVQSITNGPELSKDFENDCLIFQSSAGGSGVKLKPDPVELVVTADEEQM